MINCLMLGSGHSELKRRIQTQGMVPDAQIKWTTLDWYVKADIKFNLWWLAWNKFENMKAYCGVALPSERFDEIHAYEVLEHFGEQGNVEHFFNTFNGLWKMLKPGGLLIGSTPGGSGEWVWGDPGHSRVIAPESLVFLTEDHYNTLGSTTSSDYRMLLDGYWKILHSDPNPNVYYFALQKV